MFGKNCRILKPKHSVLLFFSDISLVSLYYLQTEESKRNGGGEQAMKLPCEDFSPSEECNGVVLSTLSVLN